jgi:spermidine/putrescine transport system substrate-binding protein
MSGGTFERRELLRRGAGVALGAAGLGAAGCGIGPQEQPVQVVRRARRTKPDGDLLIFNWTDYLDPGLVKGFEKRYRVQVRQSNFDSMEGMLAKMRAGNRYDLVFPTSDYVNRLVKGNQLLRLDRELLRNGDGLYPFFDDPWYDAGSAHTVPYAMYTTGIAWREDRVTGLSGSWNDLTLEAAKGKVFMLDDFKEGIGQANLLNGFDLNTVDEGELERTTATLQRQKEYLRGFSTNGAPNLLGGTAWIHHAWNGDLINVRNQAKDPENFRFQTCKEGIPVGSDCMAIPANAKSPGTALLFIDWVLDPEHASTNIAYFGYPMPVVGSEPAFAELASGDPAIEVTVEDLEKGSQFRELPAADKRKWDRVWTEVKA